MAKKTKTWKIGERCKGGIITVEISGNQVDVIAKDWDTSAGWNKGSNQSKAKEFDRETVSLDSGNAHQSISRFLNDLTSHYYAEQVMDWIEANSILKNKCFGNKLSLYIVNYIMNFTNKRYAPYTDEYRQPQNGQWNGHGVYDNEKNCKVYFKDWDESKKSYAEAVAKAIEMNNQIK